MNIEELEMEECSEPEPGDYILAPSGWWLGGRTYVGRCECRDYPALGEYREVEDALRAIRGQMEREQFWPNVWWCSDHGNVWQISVETGEEVRS